MQELRCAALGDKEDTQNLQHKTQHHPTKSAVHHSTIQVNLMKSLTAKELPDPH